MIRFIIKRSYKDQMNYAQFESYSTIDVDVPELEEILKSGGFGPEGYEFNQLFSCEVITKENELL